MSKIFIPLFAFLFFSKMLVAQTDTVPPVLVCKPFLEIDIPPTSFCAVVVWSIDFVDSLGDDSQLPVEVGIRKACTGSGFPENKTQLTFTIDEMGTAYTEVWARDVAGNTSSCNTIVCVNHLSGACDPGGTSIYFYTPKEDGIDSVFAQIEGSHCIYDSINHIVPGSNSPGWWANLPGLISYYGSNRPGYNLSVAPAKNINPLNGVSTYDLLLISKHILGIDPLDSPWKIIAADANQDGKVTTADIITLRKLILGISSELPNGKSWRFLPYDYTFSNPLNPFQPAFPERIESPNTADPVPSDFIFKGVKIGDVDFSADPKQ